MLLIPLVAAQLRLRTRAGDDGVDVGGASATLTGNRTFDNADLGIEAAAGVTNGGGNQAAGNVDPRQCINVRCRTKAGR